MRAWVLVASVATVVFVSDIRRATAVSWAATQEVQESCAAPGGVTPGDAADADLYCIELLPAGGIELAAGTARLVPPSSPFGIAVTKAGEPQHDVVFTLRDLPAPSSLGNYTTLIAWAVTPQLRPVVKLGEVRDGHRSSRHGLRFDRFLILITAEPSARVTRTEPTRGAARHVGERAHAAARSRVSARRPDRQKARRARRARRSCGDPPLAAHRRRPAGDWTPPPMHPQVSMPPAFMSLRPDVSSYLPAPDADGADGAAARAHPLGGRRHARR